MSGQLVAGCSSSTALAAGASFTGTGFDVKNVDHLRVSLRTDAASTVFIEFSNDAGTNWDISSSSTVTASTGWISPRLLPVGDAFRVRVLCGDTSQTFMRLRTYAYTDHAAQMTNNIYTNINVGATQSDTGVEAGDRVQHLSLCNGAASTAAYFRLYDAAAAPGAGLGTPLATFYLPAASNREIPMHGMTVANGLFIGVTADQGDADNTAVTAGDCACTLQYSN